MLSQNDVNKLYNKYMILFYFHEESNKINLYSNENKQLKNEINALKYDKINKINEINQLKNDLIFTSNENKKLIKKNEDVINNYNKIINIYQLYQELKKEFDANKKKYDELISNQEILEEYLKSVNNHNKIQHNFIKSNINICNNHLYDKLINDHQLIDDDFIKSYKFIKNIKSKKK